jgi:hypothetical protein
MRVLIEIVGIEGEGEGEGVSRGGGGESGDEKFEVFKEI